MREVQDGKVSSVTITNQNITGKTQSNQTFSTYLPMIDQGLLPQLLSKGVEVRGSAPEQQGLLAQIFISWFPFLLLIGLWWFLCANKWVAGVAVRYLLVVVVRVY